MTKSTTVGFRSWDFNLTIKNGYGGTEEFYVFAFSLPGQTEIPASIMSKDRRTQNAELDRGGAAAQLPVPQAKSRRRRVPKHERWLRVR